MALEKTMLAMATVSIGRLFSASRRISFPQGQWIRMRLWSSSAVQARLIRAATVTNPTEPFYADSGIDRVTELRSDPKWISQAFSDPKALVVPVLGTKNIVKSGKPVLLSSQKLSSGSRDSEKFVFLGLTNAERVPVFAVDLQEYSSADAEWQRDGEWVDLRRHGPELSPCDAGLLAYARGMIEWNTRNKYCGMCGSLMSSNHAGHSLKCSAVSCRNSVYPRLDPAIIVLVSSGNYILLGRQKKWDKGRYSLLAGFVEVGETFEQAAVREVKEEADIDVEPLSIKYVANQPWPFPSSLMVGLVAEVRARHQTPKVPSCGDEELAGIDEFEALPEVHTNTGELEDARWVHQDFLKDVLESNTSRCKFSVPGKHAIARFLMQKWIESDNEQDWAGKDLQTTDIDDEGKFKYVLIRVKDTHGNQKLVVRGKKVFPFHVNIIEALQEEVAPLGLQVEAMGGGKIEHSPEKQSIHVFGVSQAYGPANHKLTASILRQSFPLYNVFISSDDL